jgi:hypothetical protein
MLDKEEEYLDRHQEEKKVEKIEKTLKFLVEKQDDYEQRNQSERLSSFLSKNIFVAMALLISILGIVGAGSYEVGHVLSTIDTMKSTVEHNALFISRNGDMMTNLLRIEEEIKVLSVQHLQEGKLCNSKIDDIRHK